MCRYKGTQNLHVIDVKTILSTVGMIPFPLTAEEQHDRRIAAKYANCYYVAEKPFLSDSAIAQTHVGGLHESRNEGTQRSAESNGDYVNESSGESDDSGHDDDGYSDNSDSSDENNEAMAGNDSRP